MNNSSLVTAIASLLTVTSCTVEANQSPIVQELPIIVAKTHHTMTVQVEAHDLENDKLTYSLGLAPSFMAIDANTGLITIDAKEGHEGDYPFNVSVSDGKSKTKVINFLEVYKAAPPTLPDLDNNAPTVNNIPTISAVAGEQKAYKVRASDADNDPLTFSLKTSLPWSKVDSNTGVITVNASAKDIGTYQFDLAVSDGKEVVTKLFTVAVKADLPPVIEDIPTIEAYTDSETIYRVNATHENNKDLTFSLTGNPSWAIINPFTGMIILKPTIDDMGYAQFTLSVSDGKHTVTKPVSVNVISMDIIVNLSAYSDPEENRRNVALDWNVHPKATSYNVYRDSVLIASDVKGGSYDDVAPLSKAYDYKVVACVDSVCDVESKPVRVQIALDKFYVEVMNLDTSIANRVTFTTYTTPNNHVGAGNGWWSQNWTNTMNGKRFIENLAYNTRYKVVKDVAATNGQWCDADNRTKYSNGNDTVEALNCATPASLSVESDNMSIELDSIDQASMPLVLTRVSDGAVINSKAYTYTSSNPDVVSVTKDGALSGLAVGESVITVTADPMIYGENISVSYTVSVESNTHYVIGKIDFGQTPVLASTNNNVTVLPNRDLLVRAYALAKNAENVASPELVLKVKNGETVSSYEMVCPESLTVELPEESYTTDDSCTAMVKAVDVGSSTEYWLEDKPTGTKFLSSISSNKNNTLNLVLVPFNVNDGGLPITGTVEEIEAQILEVLPFAKVNVVIREPYVINDPNVNTGGNMGQFLGTLNSLQKNETTYFPKGKAHYMGVIHGNCNGVNGNAYIGGMSSVIRDYTCGGEAYSLKIALTHELGHNLGLNHAPCGSVAGADENFPYPNGDNSKAPIFSKKENRILPFGYGGRATTKDLMGYCNGNYLSEYNYKKIATRIETSAVYQPYEPADVAAINEAELMKIVSGYVDQHGVAHFNPIYEMFSKPVEANSDHVVVVNGEQEYNVEAYMDSDEETMYFTVSVPNSELIKDLDFKTDSKIIEKELTRSVVKAGSFDYKVNVDNSLANVSWDKEVYPWVTVVSTTHDNKREVLAHQSNTGSLSLKVPANHKDLTVSFSNGLDTITKSF